MKYLTTCIRRQGESGSSLLLQQYLCRKTPVCFACLCTCRGENGGQAGRYITGRLLDWCRRFPWHRAVRRPEKWIVTAQKELEREIGVSQKRLHGEGITGQSHTMSLRVLLCIGEEVLTMGNGQEVYLLGMSLGRGSVKRLGGSFRGSLEPGAGILLSADETAEADYSQELGGALRPSGLETEEQAARHLGEYMKRTGNRAAILLIAREDADGG